MDTRQFDREWKRDGEEMGWTAVFGGGDLRFSAFVRFRDAVLALIFGDPTRFDSPGNILFAFSFHLIDTFGF